MVPVKSLPVATASPTSSDQVNPRLDELEKKRLDYVKNEQYEKAAEVRDEIARLKKGK